MVHVKGWAERFPRATFWGLEGVKLPGAKFTKELTMEVGRETETWNVWNQYLFGLMAWRGSVFGLARSVGWMGDGVLQNSTAAAVLCLSPGTYWSFIPRQSGVLVI